MAKKTSKKKSEHDAVYLVAMAICIGIGFSVGVASKHIAGGLIVGASIGLLGSAVYYFIKRSKKAKTARKKSKYRM